VLGRMTDGTTIESNTLSMNFLEFDYSLRVRSAGIGHWAFVYHHDHVSLETQASDASIATMNGLYVIRRIDHGLHAGITADTVDTINITLISISCCNRVIL
jgi:hypothetical protein